MTATVEPASADLDSARTGNQPESSTMPDVPPAIKRPWYQTADPVFAGVGIATLLIVVLFVLLLFV